MMRSHFGLIILFIVQFVAPKATGITPGFYRHTNHLSLVQQAIWQIDGPRSAGTGFFISKDGLFVTNMHVLQDHLAPGEWQKISLKSGVSPQTRLILKLRDGTVLRNSETEETFPLTEVTVEFIPKQSLWYRLTGMNGYARDVAVLRTSVHPKSVLKIAKSGARLQEPVMVAGYPMRLMSQQRQLAASDPQNAHCLTQIDGKTLFISYGNILELNNRSFISSAPVCDGSSGSPTLNMNFEVVGIANHPFVSQITENLSHPTNHIGLIGLERIWADSCRGKLAVTDE